MMRFHLLAPACAPLALAACAVGPDYHRPEVAMPAAFIGTPAHGAEQHVELAHWWDGFGDPQMSALVDRALAQNLGLVQAAARAQQSRAQLGSATAALLPSGQVSAQAGAARL
ncbi:hypothetical protein PMI02_00003, partial [Novosphingobium sp. AP12]